MQVELKGSPHTAIAIVASGLHVPRGCHAGGVPSDQRIDTRSHQEWLSYKQRQILPIGQHALLFQHGIIC